MTAKFKRSSSTVEYDMFQAAKLACQYADIVERLMNNMYFKIWYEMQTPEDIRLMKSDQTSRKFKQASKVAGKIATNLVTAPFGFIHWSSSATKEIAEAATWKTEIWSILAINGVRYSQLRKEAFTLFL